MKKNNVITVAIMAAAVLYFAGGVQDIHRQAVPAPEKQAAVTAVISETSPEEMGNCADFMFTVNA